MSNPLNSTDPIMIVDAAIVEDGRVLLVRQRKTEAYGLWSLPGGHVEHGESLKDALSREIMEELSTNISIGHEVGMFRLKTTIGIHEIHTFAGKLDSDIALNDNELLESGWFSLSDIKAQRDQLRSAVVSAQVRAALGQH